MKPQLSATSADRIRNPVKHLDHAKKEIIAARYYDVPAEAIESAAKEEAHGKTTFQRRLSRYV